VFLVRINLKSQTIITSAFVCTLMLLGCSEPSEDLQSNLMVVYPNRANILTFVDTKTLEIVRTVTMDVPDTIQVFSMCLSTNKDYLVFSGSIGVPPFSHYLVTYNIDTDSVNLFPTGLDSAGAPRLIAAFLPDEPGLVYFYSHHEGLYSINIFSQEISMISNEKSIGKKFYHSQDYNWLALNKYIPGGAVPGHHEIEIYNVSSKLDYNQFILNNNNIDSIQIDDLFFTEENTHIFISIRLPEMRYIANYLGSYNLQTRVLYKSTLTFPWSLNPYYMSYSPERKEVYLVGAQNKFYIVDVNSSEYSLKSIVDLTGKIEGPSRILVSPDEDVAFVSCSVSGFLLAVDLENRQILKTIPIDSPYLMLQL